MKLSVIILTYNHEKFITNAIEGVLAQRTAFNYEVIIANDNSADRTAEVVSLYKKNNPDVIRLINNKKNLGTRLNFINAFNQTNGEYVALCDGDDYWDDPEKIQKQIFFLENNPEYSISFHDVCIKDEFGNPADDNRQNIQNRRDFEKGELIWNYVPTPTIVFRNTIKKLPKYFTKSDNTDSLLLFLLTQQGKAKYFPEIKPSIVRIHSGGIWTSKSRLEKIYTTLKLYYTIYRHDSKGNLNNQIEIFFKQFESAVWQADHHQSNEFWYKYNFLYLKFCFISKSYGRAYLIFKRILRKLLL